MVERFFRDVEGLITALDDYIDKRNDIRKPVVWTSKVCAIVEKVGRLRVALDNCWSVSRKPLRAAVISLLTLTLSPA